MNFVLDVFSVFLLYKLRLYTSIHFRFIHIAYVWQRNGRVAISKFSRISQNMQSLQGPS